MLKTNQKCFKKRKKPSLQWFYFPVIFNTSSNESSVEAYVNKSKQTKLSLGYLLSIYLLSNYYSTIHKTVYEG